VADAGVLRSVLKRDPELARGRIFFYPVPRPGSDTEELFLDLLDAGADVLLHGPLFDKSLLWDMLQLNPAEPVSGDFLLRSSRGDTCPNMLRHLDFLSAGGWSEAPANGREFSDIVSVVGIQKDICRVAFRLLERKNGGRLGWLRASLATNEYNPEEPRPVRGPILRPLADPDFARNGELARLALRYFGWDLEGRIASGDPKEPYLTVHRHANALVFSGYHRNEKSAQLICSPLGAPLLMGRHNPVVSGSTVIDGEIAWQHETRAFLIEGEDGTYRCREMIPAMHGVHRRILVSGMRDARLRILPDPRYLDSLRLLVDPKFPYFLDRELDASTHRFGGHLVVETPPLNGELLIEW
jgi:hypothetical protein